MKLRNILAATLFLSVTHVFAATQVPSSIVGNTVWDRTGNPFRVSGKVVVPAGTVLKIGPGAKVIFAPSAVLEVKGSLHIAGAAANPAVLDMTQGGMSSEVFINGGEARVGHARVLGGLFLARDSQVSFKGSEVTRSGGLYLQGSTKASLKGNKIYGNAAGIVLDGAVVASIQFNTLTQNTYGLYVKGFSNLTFRNNSVHGNQKEVVNLGATAPLGGNYWGTNDAASLAARIQGPAETIPLKGLKDVLRAYIRTELPVITKEMSDKMAAKERREAKQKALALKKLRKAKEEPKTVTAPPGETAVEPSPEEAPAPVVSAEPSAPEPTAPEPAAPEPVVGDTKVKPEPPAKAGEKPKVVKVTPLKPAPRSLKTQAELPPDMGDVSKIPSAPLPGGTSSFEPSAPATSSSASTDLPPGLDDLSPPDLESVPSAPAAPEPSISSPAPSSSESGDIPMPPAVEGSSTAPAASAPVPDMPPPSLGTPTESEASAAKKLGEDVPVGDIDGMQAPPLDLFGDLADVPLDDSTVGKTKPKPVDSDLSLPPLQDDMTIEPPKDLDLPPTDDLGNFNLDSKQ